MFKNVLVARDGSQHAKQALDDAVDIARTQGSRLTLLTVAAPIPVFSGFVPPVSEEELARAAERTAEEGAALVPEGIAVSSLTAEGHRGIELVKRAEAADHDPDRDGVARSRRRQVGGARLGVALRPQPRPRAGPGRARRGRH